MPLSFPALLDFRFPLICFISSNQLWLETAGLLHLIHRTLAQYWWPSYQSISTFYEDLSESIQAEKTKKMSWLTEKKLAWKRTYFSRFFANTGKKNLVKKLLSQPDCKIIKKMFANQVFTCIFQVNWRLIWYWDFVGRMLLVSVTRPSFPSF